MLLFDTLLAALRRPEDRRQVRTREIATLLEVSVPTARAYLRQLEDLGLVTRNVRAHRDPATAWQATTSPFWTEAGPYWKSP